MSCFKVLLVLKRSLLFTICCCGFIVLEYFSVAAAKPARTNDPLNPTIPQSVPQSAQPFLKKKTDLEKRLIRKNSGSSRKMKLNTFDDETGAQDETVRDASGTENGGSFGIGKIEIPNLGKQASLAVRKEDKNLMGSLDGLPEFTLKPPRGVGAYLGQTLELEVDAKSGRDEPVHFVWILNSKVVCTGKICLLPLDGETIDLGASALTIVALHTGGSVSSDHVVKVVQGRWKKGQVLNRRFVKKITSQAVTESQLEAEKKALKFDETKDFVFALNGGGVQAYPGHFQIIGDVGINPKWKGRIRSNASGVLKLVSADRGEWYVLKRSTLRFLKKDSENHREVFIEQGGVRLRTIRRSNDLQEEEQNQSLPLEDMGVETTEARVVAIEGSDVFVVKSLARAASSQETRESTRVIVISGSAQIKLKKYKENQPNFYNLSTGLELLVFDDGEVVPLRKPDADRMARLQDITISPKEVAEEISAKNAERAKTMDLAAVLKQAEGHMASEDYFEVLSTIAPVLSRLKEDVRVGYLFGVANKGLYQLEEAETYLAGAFAQDPKFYQSAWEMALIKMEDKKWDEARLWLERAKENMNSDNPKNSEYYYYSGVIDFQKENNFSARSDFTRALWEKNLESSLQGSAGGFLKTLTERKGWGLVAPFGAQYDQNVLSLTADDPVPEGFSGRSLVRSIAGLIFSVDSSGVATEPGTYLGYGAKAMAINNFPRTFSALDVIIGEVSFTQGLVSFEKVPADPSKPEGDQIDQKSVVTVTESLGIIVLNSEVSTATLTLGVNFSDYDFTAAYEANFPAGVFGESDAISLSQAKNFSVAQFETGSLTLPISLNERYPFSNDAQTGPAITLNLTPTYTHLFAPRFSGNAALKIEPNYVFATPKGILNLTAGAVAGLTYFILPWFLALPSVSIDVIKNQEKEDLIYKPSASLLFTGLF